MSFVVEPKQVVASDLEATLPRPFKANHVHDIVAVALQQHRLTLAAYTPARDERRRTATGY